MKNSISLVIFGKNRQETKNMVVCICKKCYNNLCKKISQEGGNIYA